MKICCRQQCCFYLIFLIYLHNLLRSHYFQVSVFLRGVTLQEIPLQEVPVQEIYFQENFVQKIWMDQFSLPILWVRPLQELVSPSF
jgi:hypothetical protein